MKRVWPIVATIAALIAVYLVTAPALASAPASTPRGAVTIVLAPYLTWSDVSATSTPSLWRLAEKGAVAGVNARSRVREPGQGATPLEGALAISAGAWALPEWSAPAAFDATETYGDGTAADAYRRIFGAPMGTDLIAYLGLPMTERTNNSGNVEIVLGTLGQAVRDAGGSTTAIGNSDTGFTEQDARLQRPAAVAAADTRGLVAYGSVAPDLLRPSSSAPFGKATDLAAFATAYDRAQIAARAHGGPSVTILDSGDLSRAREYAPQVTDEVAAHQRLEALKTLDAVVAMADAKRGADGVVIVTSQALFVDDAGVPEGVGPFVIAGPGYAGYATSSSTHRRGLVTNLDITATVLDALGIPLPQQVLGNPITVKPGPASAAERIERLTRENDRFIAVDAIKTTVASTLIAVALAAFALTVLVAWLAPRISARALRTWASALRAALLVALAIPAASWVALALVPDRGGATSAAAAFAVVTVGLALAAFLTAGRVGVRVPVALLSLLTASILLAEQFAGAPLSLISLIGYSPLLGARYYGMGNEAAAIAFGALIVGVALLLDEFPSARWAAPLRRWGVALLGVAFVAVAAAPVLGANVGVAIWGTAGFSVAWLLLSGRPVTWRSVLAVALIVLVIIAAFSAFDLFGGAEQTHLGRAISGAEQSGLGTLWTIIARKADANARVLSNTELSWVLVAAIGLVVFARWRPGSDWPQLLADNPALAKAVVAAATAGTLAFFTEDSGIAIPSLIALYVGVGIAWLMVARLADAGEGDRP